MADANGEHKRTELDPCGWLGMFDRPRVRGSERQAQGREGMGAPFVWRLADK